MKKWFLWLLIAVMMLSSVCATAAQIGEDAYSNAPGNPTQENVISIEAGLIQADGAAVPCEITTMAPTALTVNTLAEIFDFVEIDLKPVVRYFPEEVQAEIAAIVLPKGVDPDALYMPEFMSLQTPVFPQEQPINKDVLFSIEYEPGRLVVVVLGWEGEEGVEWKALDADVLSKDTVSYIIPAELVPVLSDREILFSVLTIKPGAGGDGTADQTGDEEFIPSVSIGDMTTIEDQTVTDGEGEPTDCRIVLVEPTERLAQEIAAMEEHVIVNQLPAMRYYDEEINRQAALLLPAEIAADELIPYELICVMAENYLEPYGDVVARMNFVTPFEDGQPVTVIIGLPDEMDEMNWMPLHAEVKEGFVECTFSSSVLPEMMNQPALLVVLSTPVAE